MRSAPGFDVFSSLFAFAVFLHLCNHASWFQTPFHPLLGAAALYSLLRPRSVVACAGLHGALLAVFAVQSPDTPNHLLLFSAISVAILASLAARCAAERSLSGIDRQRWLDTFAPAVRVLLLVVYFFAVFHKLNLDYLDPQLSCAVAIFRQSAPGWLAGWLLPHEPVAWALIFGSLASETAIPLLLWLRRTRAAGLLLGVVFHAFLGSDYPAFSTSLFACYSLFVPTAFWRETARGLSRRETWLTWGPFGFALLYMLARYLRVELSPPPEWAIPLYGSVLVLWAGVIASGLAWLLFARGGWHGVVGVEPGGRAPRWWLWLPPALLAFHGMAPYLGLRTVPAFSMFSNLRTEEARTNHLLMPDSALRVAAYQEDMVTPHRANFNPLARYARQRSRITWFTLKTLVQRAADQGLTGIFVAYERAGERREVSNAENDPALMARPTWIERKWLDFRELPPRNRCRW